MFPGVVVMHEHGGGYGVLTRVPGECYDLDAAPHAWRCIFTFFGGHLRG